MILLVMLLFITNIQHSTSKKYLNRTRINSDIFPHLAPQVTRNRVTLPYYLITYLYGQDDLTEYLELLFSYVTPSGPFVSDECNTASMAYKEQLHKVSIFSRNIFYQNLYYSKQGSYMTMVGL